MKTKLILLLTILIATTCLAQQGINYKAQLKDDSGNPLATFMNVQFTIHSATETGTIVYQEDHNYTTDATGLLILTIGTDVSPSVGIFNDIDWAANLHFLQTTITYAGGTINFDATEFLAVPYAKHATFATTSGDTKWMEGTTANDITNNNTGTTEITGTLQVQGTANIDEFSIDGTLADNSDTALPTEQAVKTYVDNNLASGLEALDEGNGIGWRLKGRDPSYYGDIGRNAVDLSITSNFTSVTKGATGLRSFAMGLDTEASGEISTAIGVFTTASGDRATAMGSGTEASGFFSTAMGSFTTASAFKSTAMGTSTQASGDFSTAMGQLTIASGYNSTAMGSRTIAPSFAETVVGSSNTEYTPNSIDLWSLNDRLFVVGNGQNSSNRSDAFTILKNGTTTINGNTFVNGSLLVQGGNVIVNGVLVHSDRRLKKDIEALPYGLKEIVQLQPKAYNWKDRTQDYKSLGLIAQEVQTLIKEVVVEQDNERKTLAVNYTELIPVLINAIKEQPLLIDKQHTKIEGLTTEIAIKDNTQNTFKNRLEKLEAIIESINQ